MSSFNTFTISQRGLSAQRLRMDLIANNIANAETTRTQGGGPFIRKLALLKELKDGGVEVDRIVNDKAPSRVVYNPTHPDANRSGYVNFPNVNISLEMADLVAATRAYEANVASLNATKRIIMKALDIIEV